MRKLFVIAVLLAGMVSCAPEPDLEKQFWKKWRIKFVNESEETVYTAVGMEYPDTLFHVYKENCSLSIPDTDVSLLSTDDALINDVVQVFVVPLDMKEGRLMDTVVARYELTQANAEKGHWTVVYKGNNTRK